MEKYLYDLFIFEISNDRSALIKLATHNKFKTEALKIPFLLHNSVEDFMIKAMKNFVWHRLNDVDLYYKTVLNITLNINKHLLTQLKKRHDIIHRNGHDLEGEKIFITDNDLQDCIKLISDFVQDIENKYTSNKARNK